MRKMYIDDVQLKKYCASIIQQMTSDRWFPEIIVGITRGGVYPAVLLSHYFGCKMVGLNVSLREDDDSVNADYGPESNCWLAEDARNGKRILIVDDINDTGATLNWIKADWEESVVGDIEWGDNVRVATIIDNESSKSVIDVAYFGESINKAEDDCWVVFPWEDFWK